MLGTNGGIISDEVSWQLYEFIEWAQANQVPRTEIRTLDGAYIHLVAPEEVEEAAKFLQEAGIEVTALAAGLFKCDLDDEKEVKQQLSSIPVLVRNAEILGTKLIRAFAFWRYHDIPAMWPRVIEVFKAALDLVPEGMILVVENEPATACATLGNVIALRAALDWSPKVGCLWDPGNYVYDTGLMQTIARLGHNVNDLLELDVKEFGSFINLMHCKNADRSNDWRLQVRTVALDKGKVDFPRLFALLDKAGVGVQCDLEPHRAAEGQQLDEAMRATPGGPGYGNSDNALEDLHILRRMLE